MKKLSTILIFLQVLFFSHPLLAQVTTSCNAEFSFQLTGNSQVQFTPAVPGDPAVSFHYWNFGDGNSISVTAPSHSYLSAGTYTVKHIMYTVGPSGTASCVDSFYRVVTIQSPTTCNLEAHFVSWLDSLNTNPANLYHFQNSSLNISPTDSIRWSFGDGTYSNQMNPVHAYSQAGTFNVCLRVIRRTSAGTLTNCISEYCNTITYNPNTCNLQAYFYFYRDSSVATSYTYHFENVSTPLASTDSIRWTFGDGSSSNQLSPNHVYTQPGTYTVCLRIIKRTSAGTLTSCVREYCKTVVIAEACNLVAGFTSTHLASTSNPYSYQFNNTSSPLSNTDSIRWSFGDGTASNAVNPVHNFAQPGTYNVCLRIIKRTANGVLSTCIREICHSITIPPVCNIQVHYAWRADSINLRKIYFNNTTLPSGITGNASWSFGDGTSASGWNTQHEYAQPGRYRVCLTVTISTTCQATWCDSITVASTVSCTAQSAFQYTYSAASPMVFAFTPMQIVPGALYTWTFGDGTGSHDINATHQYAAPGNYTVCLTVSNTCASTSCRTVSTINTSTCSNFQLAFSSVADPAIPNKIKFYAQSNTTLIDEVWTITGLSAGSTQQSIIHANDPSYVFMDTGYYRVCLKATALGGCIREYCSIIHIEHLAAPNACSLQLYPNPATTQITASVILQAPSVIHAYIYNSMNVLVRQRDQQGVTGNNLVPMTIGDLPAGSYIMRVVYGNSICYAVFQKL